MQFKELNYFNSNTVESQEAIWQAAIVYMDAFRSDLIRSLYIDPKYMYAGLPIDFEMNCLTKDQLAATNQIRDYIAFKLTQKHVRLFIGPNVIMLLELPHLESELGECPPDLDLVYPKPLIEEFQIGASHLNAEFTNERLSELEQLTSTQLLTEVYPKNCTFYLSWLCVRPQTHGQGLGKQAVQWLLKWVQKNKNIYKFNNLGVQKMSLFSSPMGIPFYKKLGFQIGGVWPHEVKSEILEHTYFYMNL